MSATLLVLALVVAGATAGLVLSRRPTGQRDVPARTSPSPSPRLPSPPTFDVVVEQGRTDTYIPVWLTPYTGQHQKVAQTFSVPDSGLRLASVQPHLAFVKGTIEITIREHPDEREAPSGPVLRRIRIDSFDGPRLPGYVPIPLRPPLPLKPGIRYSITIQAKGRLSSAGASLVYAADAYLGGRAWYFTRVTGPNGELLTEYHVWQPQYDDLTFRLGFDRG